MRRAFSVLALAALATSILAAIAGSALAREQQPGPGDVVTATFELTVVGQLPPGTRFFGVVARGQMAEAYVQLTDPDGDGVFTASVPVARGVQRGVGIDSNENGVNDIVKSFGLVTFDQDKVFSASVSFSQQPGLYIVGTPRDDRLLGENGPDLILGLGGHDAISGAYGDDLVYGGPGDDLIYGGFLVYGGSDDDALYGGSGDDALYGLSLHDLIYGGPGDDLIRGGFGNGDDALYGDLGSDAVHGDDGDDYLYSADDATADLVSGGAGSDLCIVGPEDLPYTSGCDVLYVR